MSAPTHEAPAAATPSPPAVPAVAYPPELAPRPEDFPNVHELVIEDGKPVDNIFSEKQMRLLTEALYEGWSGPGEARPFVAMANVGIFHTSGQPAIVPDVLLAVDVQPGDPTLRESRSYFVWLRGKMPDVVIEIVSNREGGEDTTKLREYARLGVPYYVLFGPEDLLGGGFVRVYQLQGRTYRLLNAPYFFEEVGIGITLWAGQYEDWATTWLRWCDRDGRPIPTGAEQAAAERQRAEAESQRAEIERQRAEAESQRAEIERQRAIQAEQQAAERLRELERTRQELARLQEKLQDLGIELPP